MKDEGRARKFIQPFVVQKNDKNDALQHHVFGEKKNRPVLFSSFSYRKKNNSLQLMPTENSENNIAIPRLDIVLLIVGTRGDVQPFIA